MRAKEVKKTIEEYTPSEGFFNLSKKPSTLTRREYAKILSIQNFLVKQEKQKDYLKEFNSVQYEQTKELAGQLQQAIFEHWDI
jgi:lysyl-tRNA synthetase class I